MKLTNKTIVITGGTSGIGRALVAQLYSQNTVIVVARPGLRLSKLTQQFQGVETHPADLAQPIEYESVADQIIKQHQHIDLLINNAAIQNTPTYIDDGFCYDSIKSEVQVNFAAVCCLSYLLLPALLERCQGAAILNINSGLALAPKTHAAVYSATKAAVNTFSQALAYQLENSHVDVLQAFLPVVETPMTQGRSGAKISAERAAQRIIDGVERGIRSHDIGKVKLLRWLLRVFPKAAHKIMKGA